MKRQFIIVSILLATIIFAACGGTTPSNNGGNKANTPVVNVSPVNGSNVNTPAEPVNSTVGTTRAAEAATSNDAPTFTPLFKAYYDAVKAKDFNALKAVMSSTFIADMEKQSGTKNFFDFMTKYDPVPEKIEARNEVINGDQAVAEFRGGSYKNWTKFAFDREGGKWKFSNRKPELESVDKK